MCSAGFCTLRFLVVFILFASASPKLGANEWIRIHSPHFEITGDIGEKRGREIALRFEQIRNVFEKLLSADKLNSPIPLQIIAFRNSKEFAEVLPHRNGKPLEGIAGWFLHNDDMNFVALDASLESGFPIAYHEYAHTVLHANFSNLPLWFDEGFATYYEATKILYNQVEIGDSPKYASKLFYVRGLMPVTELFAVTGDSKIYLENDLKRNLFYGESWLVVHYLFDKRRMGDFAKYVELRNKRRTPIPEAIESAFGMPPKKLDYEIAAYLNLGQRQIFRAEESSHLQGESFVVEPIDDLEASAAIANLRIHSPESLDEGLEEFHKILTQNPAQLNANLGLAYAALLSGNYEDAERYLETATKIGKKNARVHYLYGMLQLRRPFTAESKQQQLASAWDHLKSAARLRPEFAEAHRLLSTAYAQMGDADDAISEAKAAAALNKSNQEYFANLGQLLFDHKKYDLARSVYEQLAASPDTSYSTLAEQRLASIKEKEGDQSAPSTAASPNPVPL